MHSEDQESPSSMNRDGALSLFVRGHHRSNLDLPRLTIALKQ